MTSAGYQAGGICTFDFPFFLANMTEGVIWLSFLFWLKTKMRHAVEFGFATKIHAVNVNRWSLKFRIYCLETNSIPIHFRRQFYLKPATPKQTKTKWDEGNLGLVIR